MIREAYLIRIMIPTSRSTAYIRELQADMKRDNLYICQGRPDKKIDGEKFYLFNIRYRYTYYIETRIIKSLASTAIYSSPTFVYHRRLQHTTYTTVTMSATKSYSQRSEDLIANENKQTHRSIAFGFTQDSNSGPTTHHCTTTTPHTRLRVYWILSFI